MIGISEEENIFGHLLETNFPSRKQRAKARINKGILIIEKFKLAK